MSLPALPFSKTRRAGGLIFLSGEMPLSSDGSIPAGIGPQTDLALERIAATLASQGASMADVISCTVYLADKADFRQFLHRLGYTCVDETDNPAYQMFLGS